MPNVDVYCVSANESDVVVWLDSAVTPRDIPILSVADMVTKLIARFGTGGGDKIGELRIVGHGDKTGQDIGADWIDSTTLPSYRSELHRLFPLFGPEALVTMGGCRAGHNGGLLLELSNIWNVPVRGFTANQRPLIPGDEGNETKCYITCARSHGGNLFDPLDDAIDVIRSL